jgi:hypothetical protein
MRGKVLLLLVLGGIGVQGCGDDAGPDTPPISVGGDSGSGGRSGSGGPFVPMGGRGGDGDDDGGQDEEDGGAGTGGGSGGSGGTGGSDGPRSCEDVDPVPPGFDPDPTMLPNVVTLPEDLEVTRASAEWEEGCDQPTLRVTISSGNCPDGDGHELTFFLPANGVADSTVVLGLNQIMEDQAGYIRVRYTRPGRINPSGEWGTCEGASGTLNITGELELLEGRTLQGDFFMELTRCDSGSDPALQQLDGSFNVEVPASLDDVCP